MTTSRGRGPGTSGLLELSALLSPRDWAVLEELHRHRFLTSTHVERLLFHEHATSDTAARTCRRTLERLHGYRLTERLTRRVGGVRAGSAATVWALSSTGARLRGLRHGDGSNPRFREPSQRFVAHYLAIADTLLAAVEAARAGRFELTRAQLEPDCWRRYLGRGGATETLAPDLYLVTASGEYEDHWFVEVDLGSEHIPTLIRKCRQYLAYQATGSEQADGGVFPLVLWVVQTEARASKLRDALRAARLDERLFRIATPATLIAALTTNDSDADDDGTGAEGRA